MSKVCDLLGMTGVSRGALMLVLALAGWGCAAAPNPVRPAGPVVNAVSVTKEEAPDLSPVAAPAELVALLRFKQPRTAIETVATWANFPVKLRDLLPPDLSGLDQVLAWNAPLEAAVALDPAGEDKVPEPLAVVSIGLTSLDGALEFARAKGQSVRRLRPGVYQLGDADYLSCVAGVAVGSAPARLVCGHRMHDVDGLFNYATRGLPNEPLPNLDFQAELRLQPIKKKYEAEIGSARLLAGFLLRQVQIDNPRFDRALSDVAYALIDEGTAVARDLDAIRLDANIDSEQNVVDARVGFKFVAQTSWLVQASTEMLSRREPAPELFWQMPSDSAAAGFGVGWKPGRLRPLGHTLADLLDAYLESEKVTRAVRDRASKSIEGLFDLDTKQVRAQGELRDLPQDQLLAADYRMFGWQIAAVVGEPKPWLAVLDDLQATLGSRDIARVLKQRAEIDAKLLPKFSAHGVQVRGFKPGAKAYRVDLPRDLFEKLSKNPLNLGPDAAVKGKAPIKTVPLSLIVAFDGERTWLALSADEKAIVQRLESLKMPNTPVLRTRSGLDALKNTPRAAAGFFTLTRMLGQLPLLGARGGDSQKLIGALPHHGETPIVCSYDLVASGPDVTTHCSVPRAAIEDLGALVPTLAIMGGSGNSVLAP